MPFRSVNGERAGAAVKSVFVVEQARWQSELVEMRSTSTAPPATNAAAALTQGAPISRRQVSVGYIDFREGPDHHLTRQWSETPEMVSTTSVDHFALEAR